MTPLLDKTEQVVGSAVAAGTPIAAVPAALAAVDCNSAVPAAAEPASAAAPAMAAVNPASAAVLSTVAKLGTMGATDRGEKVAGWADVPDSVTFVPPKAGRDARGEQGVVWATKLGLRLINSPARGWCAAAACIDALVEAPENTLPPEQVV